MAILAAGSSVSLNLPAGRRLITSGPGVASFSNGAQAFLSASGSLGPFTADRTVYLTATAAALQYELDGVAPAAALYPVQTPTGFRWAEHGLTLRRAADGSILTDFDPTLLYPAITATYYVDPVAGSNANAGTSRALPLKDLATALAKADADQIRIINLTGDYFGRTVQSWNNVQPSRSLSVVVEGPYRYVSVCAASAVLPTWSVNGTYSNVYSATITAAAASGVVDLSTREAHPVLAWGSSKHAAALASVATPFRVLTKVASLAAVAAQAGSWYHDGTQLHVRAHDDRNLIGDTRMQPTSNGNNGRFPAVSGLTIAVQGVDFVGGRPWYSTATEAAAVTGTVAVFNDCTFQAGGVANGLGIEMFQTVYLYRCGAFSNWNDGFNYHCPTSPTAAGLNVSPSAIEIECVAYRNGTTGSSAVSDNASTAHEYANVIRLNCVYPDSDDRVMVDIDNVHAWALGCYIGQARQVASGKESIAALNNCAMWLDSCTTLPGANPQWTADQSAVLRHFNSGAVVNAAGATGAVRSYLG